MRLERIGNREEGVDGTDGEAQGPMTLILFERDGLTTKLRKAFDALPKDFTGRVERDDVLSCLSETRKSITKILKGLYDPILDATVNYLDRVLKYALENSWPKVNFDEFCTFLNCDELSGENDGSVSPRSPRPEDLPSESSPRAESKDEEEKLNTRVDGMSLEEEK